MIVVERLPVQVVGEAPPESSDTCIVQPAEDVSVAPVVIPSVKLKEPEAASVPEVRIT